MTLIIFGAFDEDIAFRLVPAGANFKVWVFIPELIPEVFSRTIRVIVGFRFNVEFDNVVVVVVCLALLASPRASFPASVKAKVLEGSETRPVASRVAESSGNNVIPWAANNLTASSEMDFKKF